MWQKLAGEVWLEKAPQGQVLGGCILALTLLLSLSASQTPWGKQFSSAMLYPVMLSLLHPRPRIRWLWAGNLWNSEPKPIFLHLKLFQLFAELCLTIHCLPQRFYCFQRLCVPCIFYFSLLGLFLLYFGGQALPSVFAMHTYIHVLFLSWLNSHLPCALLPVGSQLTYHPSAMQLLVCTLVSPMRRWVSPFGDLFFCLSVMQNTGQTVGIFATKIHGEGDLWFLSRAEGRLTS